MQPVSRGIITPNHAFAPKRRPKWMPSPAIHTSISRRSEACVNHLQSSFRNGVDPINHQGVRAKHDDLSLFFVHNLQDLPRCDHGLADALILESDQEPNHLLVVGGVLGSNASHENWEDHELAFNQSVSGNVQAKLDYPADTF